MSGGSVNNEPERPEDKWPAVGAAYDFVLPSYQWMVASIDAAVGRIQVTMTLAATVTLGFPVLARSVKSQIAFASPWFILALVFFLAAFVMGMIAKSWGTITLASPSKLHDSRLHLSEWEFKQDAIYFAGVAFSRNAALVNLKARLNTWMSALLLAEVIAFVIWLAR
jgi:hypothetical protein